MAICALAASATKAGSCMAASQRRAQCVAALRRDTWRRGVELAERLHMEDQRMRLPVLVRRHVVVDMGNVGPMRARPEAR